MRTRKTFTVTRTVYTKKLVIVKTKRWLVEPCYVRVGKAIRECRESYSMTQLELSRKLKISRPSLANMEVGRQRILLHDIFKIERLFPLEPKGWLVFAARKWKP